MWFRERETFFDSLFLFNLGSKLRIFRKCISEIDITDRPNIKVKARVKRIFSLS